MPGKHWIENERSSLRDQLCKSVSLVDVRVNGRTQHAIRGQAVRMGLVEQRETRATWSNKEKRRLRKLKREGYSARDVYILQLLDESRRSYWAIRKQWGRMKLADRTLSRRLRKKKVWKRSEQKRFRQFLLENSATMTPEQIGKTWGVARSTVARCQSVLGVKQPREKVMQMDYSLAKQKRARQRIRRKNIRRWAVRREHHESELLSLAAEFRDRHQPPKERVCTECGRSWPIRRKFFHYSEKNNGFGTSRYYKNRCRLCQNTRRRERDRRQGRNPSMTKHSG